MPGTHGGLWGLRNTSREVVITNNAVEWNVFIMEHDSQNNFWITEAFDLKEEWDQRKNPWEK